MSVRKGILILAGLLTLAAPALASAQKKVREGNRAFAEGNWDEALKKYSDALLDEPESPKIHYNLANVLYRQNKHAEAVTEYEKALQQATDPRLLQDAHFNRGNGYFQQSKYLEAIDAYQKVLELNPDDRDAKANLELARRKLQEQAQMEEQESPPSPQSEPGQQSPESQGQQGEQERESGDQGEQQQPGQPAAAGDQEEPESPPAGEAQKLDELDPEEAARILEALLNEEEEALKEEQQRQVPARQGRPAQDW